MTVDHEKRMTLALAALFLAGAAAGVAQFWLLMAVCWGLVFVALMATVLGEYEPQCCAVCRQEEDDCQETPIGPVCRGCQVKRAKSLKGVA